MKKLIIALVGSLALGATLPAFSGPDGQLIEQGRKEKQSDPLGRQGDVLQNMEPPAAVDTKCRLPRLVLPLDHGPRASTTPQANELRKQRYEAQLKACEGTTK